jgi:hypothetical protein
VFFILSFLSYKIVEQEGRISPVQGEGWHQWEGEVMRKGGRRVNTVQKPCTHVSKYKNDTC